MINLLEVKNKCYIVKCFQKDFRIFKIIRFFIIFVINVEKKVKCGSEWCLKLKVYRKILNSVFWNNILIEFIESLMFLLFLFDFDINIW